jgi:prepilin-type N-terminal cleavage/methylation domain-containing protein
MRAGSSILPRLKAEREAARISGLGRIGRRLADRGGMTLIELLAVVILIGIIAAIALNALDSKERAYLTVMRSDLRNVMTAQENYFAEHGKYANSTPELGYNASPYVNLLVVGDSTSWAARTQHEIRADYRCATYMGDANPIFPPAQEEAEVECLPKRKTGRTRKGR